MGGLETDRQRGRVGKWVMGVSEQRFLHSQFLSGAEREAATTTKQTNNNNKTKRGEWGRVGRVGGGGCLYVQHHVAILSVPEDTAIISGTDFSPFASPWLVQLADTMLLARQL